jgi:hypothetical protein
MKDEASQKDATVAGVKFFASLFGDEQFQKDLEDGRTFKWCPLTDITVTELAVCMYLVPLVVTGEHWQHQLKVYDALPDYAKRHFEVVHHDPTAPTYFEKGPK